MNQTCVNALHRANPISTGRKNRFSEDQKAGVNALHRANPISTETLSHVRKEGKCVNALHRANPISTERTG